MKALYDEYDDEVSVPGWGWGCILHRQLWAARLEPFPSSGGVGNASEEQGCAREMVGVSVPGWGWGFIDRAREINAFVRSFRPREG